MSVEERIHRFTDQVLNACVLTIGLYIATIPMTSSTSSTTHRAAPNFGSAQPLAASPPSVQTSSQPTRN